MFFTLADLASRYHCQPISIRRWFAAGKFPSPVQINHGRLLWPAAAIEEFEARFEKHDAAEPKPKVKKEFA